MKVLVKELLLVLMNKKTFGLLCSIALSTTVFANDIKLSGEIKQGGYVLGKTNPQNTVSLDGTTLTVSEHGDFVLGFSRDDTEEHQLLITTPSGEVTTKVLKPIVREYNIQRIEGIAKKIMQPDPKAIARSKKDSKQVKAARSLFHNLNAFSQGFIPPIKGIITGVYGSQRFYNGKPKSPHYGLDYAGKTGDPVKAPADGIITMYVPDMFFSGGTMIIDHGHGITSSFLHLSDSYVKPGDIVKQGDVVAAVGSSGRATGPHLDWRINWYQTRIDPKLVLETKPIK